MLDRVRQIQIEQTIIEILEDYDLAVYPLSVGNLAGTLGIELVGYSSLSREACNLAETASQDAFSISSPDYSRTQIVFEDRGTYFFRSRFSGAHEIGHIVLEHPRGGGLYELEADYFAGYLLAPHPLVSVLADRANITDKFGISQQCASFAIDQTNARLSERHPWRKHEEWLLEHATWRGGGLVGRA